jgi:hypothetical protein
MTIQFKQIIQEPKPLFAGIDVGAEELISFFAGTAPLARRRNTATPC